MISMVKKIDLKALLLGFLILIIFLSGCTSDISGIISDENSKEYWNDMNRTQIQGKAREVADERIQKSYMFEEYGGHGLYMKEFELLNKSGCELDEMGEEIEQKEIDQNLPCSRISYEYFVDIGKAPEHVGSVVMEFVISGDDIIHTSFSEVQKPEPLKQERSMFELCADAGNEVLEPDCEGCPRQCILPNGTSYFEDLEMGVLPVQDDIDGSGDDNFSDKDGNADKPVVCKDMCGDGICQEIVCLGSGCPCAETINNCEEDCK